MSLDVGSHHLLEPEPPGSVAQGRHLRRPSVHPRGATTTATATRCCSSSSRREAAPATSRASTAASIRVVRSGVIEPSRDEFHELAAAHTVVPVWRELVADLITPVAAFGRLVADEPGFLLESVEHGERWSRFSFVGRRPLATVRQPGRAAHGRRRARLRRCPPTRECSPFIEAATRALSIARPRPAPAAARWDHGVPRVRRRPRGRAPARRPDRRPGPSRRRPVDHRAAGRLRPLPATRDPGRQRPARAATRPPPSSTAAYDAAVGRLDQMAADGARSVDEPLVEPPRPDDLLPDVVSRRWAPVAVRGRGRGRPRSTCWPATSSRSCCHSASTSSSKPTRSTSTGCCAR